VKIFQDPDNPEKIIIESYPYTVRYIRKRGKDGKPCKPWVIEEAAIMDVRRMDWKAKQDLDRYRRRAFPNAVEKAKELSKTARP